MSRVLGRRWAVCGAAAVWDSHDEMILAIQSIQFQKKNASGRVSAEGEAASGEAGQSRGVVRAPRRSHLPAVRAVSEICEGVVERAKIALLGS